MSSPFSPTLFAVVLGSFGVVFGMFWDLFDVIVGRVGVFWIGLGQFGVDLASSLGDKIRCTGSPSRVNVG